MAKSDMPEARILKVVLATWSLLFAACGPAADEKPGQAETESGKADRVQAGDERQLFVQLREPSNYGPGAGPGSAIRYQIPTNLRVRLVPSGTEQAIEPATASWKFSHFDSLPASQTRFLLQILDATSGRLRQTDELVIPTTQPITAHWVWLGNADQKAKMGLSQYGVLLTGALAGDEVAIVNHFGFAVSSLPVSPSGWVWFLRPLDSLDGTWLRIINKIPDSWRPRLVCTSRNAWRLPAADDHIVIARPALDQFTCW
jgi:hypothetical protein